MRQLAREVLWSRVSRWKIQEYTSSAESDSLMPSESVTNWRHQKLVTERRQAVIQDDITPGHSWYEKEC